MNGAVRVEIRRIGRTEEADVVAMERLYRTYYEGAADACFRRDLAEKDFVILLREESCVRGFSTLKLLRVAECDVLFSGDTVVDQRCRNQWGLAGGFGHIMRFLSDSGMDNPYWLLICKGARTYRFLPTFFNRYVPGAADDPELSNMLRRVAGELFPEVYDQKTGVLCFGSGKDRLRADALRQDAESVRFRMLNPNWAQGDELCCLASLRLDNLNNLGRRVIAAVDPVWYL